MYERRNPYSPLFRIFQISRISAFNGCLSFYVLIHLLKSSIYSLFLHVFRCLFTFIVAYMLFFPFEVAANNMQKDKPSLVPTENDIIETTSKVVTKSVPKNKVFSFDECVSLVSKNTKID